MKFISCLSLIFLYLFQTVIAQLAFKGPCEACNAKNKQIDCEPAGNPRWVGRITWCAENCALQDQVEKIHALIEFCGFRASQTFISTQATPPMYTITPMYTIAPSPTRSAARPQTPASTTASATYMSPTATEAPPTTLSRSVAPSIIGPNPNAMYSFIQNLTKRPSQPQTTNIILTGDSASPKPSYVRTTEDVDELLGNLDETEIGPTSAAAAACLDAVFGLFVLAVILVASLLVLC